MGAGALLEARWAPASSVQAGLDGLSAAARPGAATWRRRRTPPHGALKPPAARRRTQASPAAPVNCRLTHGNPMASSCLDQVLGCKAWPAQALNRCRSMERREHATRKGTRPLSCQPACCLTNARVSSMEGNSNRNQRPDGGHGAHALSAMQPNRTVHAMGGMCLLLSEQHVLLHQPSHGCSPSRCSQNSRLWPPPNSSPGSMLGSQALFSADEGGVPSCPLPLLAAALRPPLLHTPCRCPTDGTAPPAAAALLAARCSAR